MTTYKEKKEKFDTILRTIQDYDYQFLERGLFYHPEYKELAFNDPPFSNIRIFLIFLSILTIISSLGLYYFTDFIADTLNIQDKILDLLVLALLHIGLVSGATFIIHRTKSLYDCFNQGKTKELNVLIVLVYVVLYISKAIDNRKLYIETEDILSKLRTFKKAVTNSNFKNQELLEKTYAKYKNTFEYLTEYLLLQNFNDLYSWNIEEFKEAFQTVQSLILKDLETIDDLRSYELKLKTAPIKEILKKDFESKKETI